MSVKQHKVEGGRLQERAREKADREASVALIHSQTVRQGICLDGDRFWAVSGESAR